MAEIKGGLGKSIFSAGGLILVLVILILANVIIARANLRWDATEDNLYSLSDGTKNILSGLEKDVIIKVFYSKSNVNIPLNIKTYSGRMLDFLSEYEYHSNGRVTVEVYDPKPDSEEEEWAQKYGLQGAVLPAGEKVYFGLVAVCEDQEESIAMMDPTGEAHLEYDMTRIISRVHANKRPKIGVISGHPVFGSPQTQFGMQNPAGQMEQWLFISELKKLYDVKELAALEPFSIDPDIDLIIIIHPKNFSDGIHYAIDQYVLKGGNLIVLVDPLSVMDMSQGMAKSSSMDKLFGAWGVRMDASKAVVDMNYPTKLRNQRGEVEDNPMWISVPQQALSRENLITSGLETMLLPVAGALEKIPESMTDYEPLLQSSATVSLVDAFKSRFGVSDLRKDFKSSDKKVDLAVKISGIFTTAYPEGKPAAKDGKGKEAKPSDGMTGNKTEASLKEGVKNSTIIIISDTDFIYDGYYVQKQNFLGFDLSSIFNDNLNFMLNSSEVLSGAEALIGIRSRGIHARPFTRVRELEKKAQAKWLSREQELVRSAENTNRILKELEQKKDASQKLIMSEEQESEIEKFQKEKIRLGRELKIVRRNLRADIESLGVRVKVLNIFLVPFLVCLAGSLYALYRKKKSI